MRRTAHCRASLARRKRSAVYWWAITSSVEARSRTQRRDLAEGLRVKRREALIEDDEVCVLEERPGDVEAAPFAMGELPARLADHLQQSGWHAVEEVPEAELAAEGFGLLQIFRLCRPAAAHQQVEGEGSREDVVLVELRRPHHAPPPALGPERLPVESLEEEETRLRARRPVRREARVDLPPPEGPSRRMRSPAQIRRLHASENRLAPLVVAEDEIVRIEDWLAVLALARAGVEREGEGRRSTDLRAGRRVEEEGDLLPGNRCAHEMRQPRHQLC